jgi:ankyrin repeat protein
MGLGAWNSSSTSIHVAAAFGDQKRVQTLVRRGADINATNKFGDTALHTAVRQGKKEVIRLLLEEGADGNAKNVYGATPLQLASEIGNTGPFLVLHNWLHRGQPINVERGKLHFMYLINGALSIESLYV